MKIFLIKPIACSLLSLVSIVSYGQRLGGTSADAKITTGNTSGGNSLSSLYSPNLYDGSANVNIPIFQYETVDGNNCGVSLTYNTKGIKSEQHGGAIGLNWNLNAGGSIQRTIKDVPDEMNIPWFYDNVLDYGGGYIDFRKLRGRYAVAAETVTQESEMDVFRDRESDDFVVSCGALSFTFNIGKKGAIFTNPQRNVKVEILKGNWLPITMNPFPTDLNTTLSFRITDEQGVQYYFEGSLLEDKDLNSEYSNFSGWSDPLNLIKSYRVFTQWNLRKIVASDGTEVRYEYQTEPNPSWPTDLSLSNVYYKQTEPLAVSVSAYRPSLNKYISKILYPNNTVVDFIYDGANPMVFNGRCDGGITLKKIKVSSQTNSLNYIFNQAYFVAAISGNTSYEKGMTDPCGTLGRSAHRLKLKSIQIASSDETIVAPFYSFDYDTTPLGLRGAGQDCFGYYNGKIATGNAIGSTAGLSTPIQSGAGIDKMPDFNYAKAGILTRINNSYGGSVQFDYEPHQLTNGFAGWSGVVLPADANFIGSTAADGIRLRSIKESDTFYANNFLRTTFTYEDGQIFMPGGYFNYNLCMQSATSATPTESIFSTSYVSPHQFVNGGNHGYSKVTAVSRINDSRTTSAREITFTNFKDATSNNIPRYFVIGGGKHYFTFPYTDKQYLKDWEMGLPMVIIDYDQNYRISKKTLNTYRFVIDTISASQMKVENQKVTTTNYLNAPLVAENWGGAELDVFQVKREYDNYRPFRGRTLLDKTESFDYVNDNVSVNDVVLYTYDSRSNVKTITTSNSDGIRYKTEKVYNYDLSATMGSTLSSMSALEKQIGMAKWKLGTTANPTNDLVDANITGYTYNNGKLAARNIYTLNIDQPLPYNTFVGYTGGPYVPQPYQNMAAAFNGSDINYFQKISEAVLKDNKMNTIESRSMDKDIYNAVIWDTINGKKRAEVTNAHYADIAYNSFDVNPVVGNSVIVNFGNMTYNVAQVVSNSVSGHGGYKLSQGQLYAGINGFFDLMPGKEYVLSFWAQGNVPEIKVGSSSLTATAPEALYSINGWNNYQIKFIASVAAPFKFMLPATGVIYVDEIRLFPANASMGSQTYEPLFGVSSATDASGRISYYEYDKLGRQTIVRDQDGNILSKTKFAVKQAD